MLAQIETDKVTIDVRYTEAQPGVVSKVLINDDDTVSVGQDCFVVDVGATGGKESGGGGEKEAPKEEAAPPPKEEKKADSQPKEAAKPPPAIVSPPTPPAVTPPPVAALPPATYRVLGNVSQGIHNMRSGPGTNFPLVTSMPAGATGITIGRCQRPQDGRSGHPWCEVKWREFSGWASACCMVDTRTGAFPR